MNYEAKGAELTLLSSLHSADGGQIKKLDLRRAKEILSNVWCPKEIS